MDTGGFSCWTKESLDLFISSREDISQIMLTTEEFVSISGSNQEVKITVRATGA